MLKFIAPMKNTGVYISLDINILPPPLRVLPLSHAFFFFSLPFPPLILSFSHFFWATDHIFSQIIYQQLIFSPKINTPLEILIRLFANLFFIDGVNDITLLNII